MSTYRDSSYDHLIVSLIFGPFISYEHNRKSMFHEHLTFKNDDRLIKSNVHWGSKSLKFKFLLENKKGGKEKKRIHTHTPKKSKSTQFDSLNHHLFWYNFPPKNQHFLHEKSRYFGWELGDQSSFTQWGKHVFFRHCKLGAKRRV